MEVNSNNDVEIDNLLLQQFSCMGTQDKEVLITQFESLFGSSKPTRDVCMFYLEMNNWNLPAAIGSYFEYNQEASSSSSSSSFFNNSLFPSVTPCLPSASFVGYGEDVSDLGVKIAPPNSNFIFSWQIKNSGSEAWPIGTTLKYLEGTKMSLVERVPVERVGPSEIISTSVPLISPSLPGLYESTYQLSTITGQLFGDPLKLSIQVSEAHFINNPNFSSSSSSSSPIVALSNGNNNNNMASSSSLPNNNSLDTDSMET